MEQEKLYKQYYVEFGVFPPIMMTTDGDGEEYLKAIEKAIERKKPLTSKELDEVYNKHYDLVTSQKEEEPTPDETEETDRKQASELFGLDLKKKGE